MRDIPDDFYSVHFGSSKEPIQVIEIEFADDDFVYLTSHKGTETPDGFDVVQGCISSIVSTSQKIDPSAGRSTIGNIRFSALDIDDAITTFLSERDADELGFRHKTVRVYAGLKDMSNAQIRSNLVQTQIITGVSESKGAYTFQLGDIQRTTRNKIFTKATARLSYSISSTSMLVPVLTTDGFETMLHDEAFTDAPGERVGYGIVDDEVIRYTGTTIDGTYGLCFVVDERGALNTVATSHEVDPEDTSDRATFFEEFVYLEMAAPKLVYAILTGKLHGQGSETLPEHWHLNIPDSLVRLDDFTNAGEDLWDTSDDEGFILRFSGEKEQDGKQFLEQQVCLLMSAFMPVYATGELGFKLATNVLHNAPYVFELNEDSVKDFGVIKFDADQVHNILSVEWNYDFLRDTLTRQRLVVDNLSRAKYGDAPIKSLKFRGLHGSRHTVAAIEAIFDRLRDRFSAPPIAMTLSGMPFTNMLEVGDVVRVNLEGGKDYFVNGSLDRAMEVQSVKIDWTTGNVDLTLFGSSQAAGLITPLDPGNEDDPSTEILPDSWYTSGGTDLASYGGVTITDVGGVGHITGGSGLVGGDTLSDGRYYYDGDLELDSGVTLQYTRNILLKVKGHFQINGTLDGEGNGLDGATKNTYSGEFEATDRYNERNSGQSGYLKAGPSGGGVQAFVQAPSTPGWASGTGLFSTVPPISISYRTSHRGSGFQVLGIPSKLEGSTGKTGHNSKLFDFAGVLYGIPYKNIAGGSSGKSGAGIFIACRGASFGSSGEIITSGLDGGLGDTDSFTFQTQQGGSGAGGAPGAVVFCIDGIANTVPSLANVTAKYGASPYSPGVPASSPDSNGWPDGVARYSYYVGYGDTPPDLSGYGGGARVVFVPPKNVAAEDLPEPTIYYYLNTVTGLNVVSGTATLLPAFDGGIRERMLISWDASADEYAAGYDIQTREVGTTQWLTAGIIRDVDEPQIYVDVTDRVSYDIRVRAIGDRDNVVRSGWVKVTHKAIGKSERPSQVNGFTVSMQPDGTRQFDATPIADFDLAGYVIRWALGTESDWSVMIPLHTGLIVAWPFETNQLAAGDYTVAVKAVDRSGNESEEATFITSTLGDPRIKNAFAYVQSHTTGWSGTRVNCDPDSTGYRLVTLPNFDYDYLDTKTWDELDAMALVGTGHSTISYQEEVDLGAVIPFVPLVTVSAVGNQLIEISTSDDDVTWSSFAVASGMESGRYVRVRCTLTQAGSEILAFNTFTFIASGEIVEEFINDTDTSTWAGSAAAGRVVPVTKDFSVITKISVALQNVGPGWDWDIIDKSDPSAPEIRIYNGSGVASDALIDIEIKGLPAVA